MRGRLSNIFVTFCNGNLNNSNYFTFVWAITDLFGFSMCQSIFWHTLYFLAMHMCDFPLKWIFAGEPPFSTASWGCHRVSIELDPDPSNHFIFIVVYSMYHSLSVFNAPRLHTHEFTDLNNADLLNCHIFCHVRFSLRDPCSSISGIKIDPPDTNFLGWRKIKKILYDL